MIVTRCSSEGCQSPPDESLVIEGHTGHVHDCKLHAAELREFCAVTGSKPILTWVGVDPAQSIEPVGEDEASIPMVIVRDCQYRPCTGDAYIGQRQQPTPL